MVKFLIKHPIGVSMSFLALVLAGIVAGLRLPVSLMPDVDIPEINIQIKYPNASSREIETRIITPLRHNLLQLNHLKDIKAESKPGNAFITLFFEHGTKTDYAFMEVNERVEKAMVFLPRDMQRPVITKASVSDIPVFYLHCRYKDKQNDNISELSSDFKFVELSTLVSNLIKKRIEQLDEIAVADISGTANLKINILPDIQKMNALGLSCEDISQTILSQNITAGTLSMKDKQFQYFLKIGQKIKDINEIKNLYFKSNNKIFQLKDFANVELTYAEQRGVTLINNKSSVTLALIKQPDAQTESLKENLNTLLEKLETDYPDISFEISRNQTKLLDYSLSNLKLSLITGGFLAFLILFLFMGNIKAPLLIGVSIPVSLIISLLFFYFIGLSLNIISLSGLTLGIGLMIDNSIIVTDNINRYRIKGDENACVKATNEIIRPLLSSTLTTIAIFLPLSLLSGKAGALFYEQAMAVTITLLVSFFVSIMLLPVLFSVLFNNKTYVSQSRHRFNIIESIYNKTSHFVLRKQKIALSIFLIFIFSGIVIFNYIPKAALPEIKQNNFSLKIDWNEPVNLSENIRRSKQIYSLLDTSVLQTVSFIGEQDFMVGEKFENDITETNIFIQTKTYKDIEKIKQKIQENFKNKYPKSDFSFSEKENAFKKIFSDENAALEIRLRTKANNNFFSSVQINDLLKELKNNISYNIENVPKLAKVAEISMDVERMMFYDISRNTIHNQLEIISGKNIITDLKNNDAYVPVSTGVNSDDFTALINTGMIRNNEGKKFPLHEFIKIRYITDFKSIKSDKTGEYFPIYVSVPTSGISNVAGSVNKITGNFNLKADFTGAFYQNKKLINEFAFILLVSFLLLYFILSAQFESFTVPLIILLELPIDIAGALIFLYIFDLSINIMSLTGIIVMTGIIINDSILKIDTINQLINKNTSVIRAIKTAGLIRLKPILMTSITTILAVAPFLFISGFGSDLQKPLAVALIGGMTVGTVVSLFYIPLFYLLLKRIKIYTKKIG